MWKQKRQLFLKKKKYIQKASDPSWLFQIIGCGIRGCRNYFSRIPHLLPTFFCREWEACHSISREKFRVSVQLSELKKVKNKLSAYPTELCTNLEPYNPSFDVCHLHKICWPSLCWPLNCKRFGRVGVANAHNSLLAEDDRLRILHLYLIVLLLLLLLLLLRLLPSRPNISLLFNQKINTLAFLMFASNVDLWIFF